MTHDELLALINDEIEVCEPDCNQHHRVNAPWLALRKVVELHKPGAVHGTCKACEFNDWFDCPTIKVIIEALA